MSAQNRWQEVIAENLSAASVPGYKKQDVAFSAFEAGMMPPTGPGAANHYSLPHATSQTDYRQGDIRFTGAPTDMAIDGQGFFEVQMPDGQSAYTRDGQFHVDNQGQLVTKEGYSVMGQGGPIRLDRAIQGEIHVSPTGEISKGTTPVGKLRIMTFADTSQIATIGGGWFVPADKTVQPQEVANPSVRQKFIEGSNTSTITEMTDLITSMRAFEANQKVIQTQDERMGKTIQELGSPS
jgi:flagellar basal-body rod protein FlgG